MLRSLFAGISGLRTNQTMLDVTGNNIANANTTGFKSSTTVFSDTLSQMLTSGSGSDPAAARGGTNPVQIGLGVQLAATSTNFNQGSAQLTNRPTDLMIQGDGFFVLQDGAERLYTRAGAFSFDESGTLVAPNGMRVQADGGGPVTLPAGTQSYSVTPTGVVRIVDATGTAVDFARLQVASFANPMGLEKAGDTAFRESANSGAATLGVAGAAGNGQVMAGALEMSNVDLSAEFTNLILAQRGFQAASRVITTSDQVLEELVNIKR